MALSAVWAMIGQAASALPTLRATVPTEAAPTAAAITASSTTTAPPPTTHAIPVLRTPQQFDEFVLASNTAGYLVVVLFHADWSLSSRRMQGELQAMAGRFTGRRIVFARVDRESGPEGGRCAMTQMHRVTATPTVRMYHNKACVDQIIGCRPIDLRQAAADACFKYHL